MFPKPLSWVGMGTLHLTQQKHTITNKKKCTTTQNKHKRLQKGGWRSSPRDLDLGLGQGHISMYNTCRTTSIPDHV